MGFSRSVDGSVNDKHWQTGSFCSVFVFETKSLVAQAGFELIARDDFVISTFQCCDDRLQPPRPVYEVLGLELGASSRSARDEH